VRGRYPRWCSPHVSRRAGTRVFSPERVPDAALSHCAEDKPCVVVQNLRSQTIGLALVQVQVLQRVGNDIGMGLP
jgi:hypothetical protein